MTLGDDERRPGKGGGSSERLAGRLHSPTSSRQTPQVWAECHEVAGRDRFRLELFVMCVCGHRHAHRAPVGFISGLRRGPCGARYVVRAAVVLEAAA